MRHRMKNRLRYHSTLLEVLHYNPLEELWGHLRIPHAFGIDHQNWSAGAYAETGRFAAFYTGRAEEKPLPVE